MIARRSPLRPTKKFPLPTWLMVVIFLNIFSIIGFLVLLPNPDSSPVVPTRLPHPNNGTIYLCWIGKSSHELSTIQSTALQSILLYHPTRPLVILSSSEHIPVDTGAEHDISIIPSPDLVDFNTCLERVLPLLLQTGGSLFSDRLIWTKSSDFLPALFLPLMNEPPCVTEQTQQQQQQTCIGHEDHILLLNLSPLDPIAAELQEEIDYNANWRCDVVRKLATTAVSDAHDIIYRLPSNWTSRTHKDFDVIRSISYALIASSQEVYVQLATATRNAYTKPLLAPRWFALDYARLLSVRVLIIFLFLFFFRS